MKRNHLFSIITAGMLTITLLAGCGNTGSNANGNTGSNTNTHSLLRTTVKILYMGCSPDSIFPEFILSRTI